MKIQLKEFYEFIPEFNDNKSSEEPIVFNLKLLSEHERLQSSKTNIVEGKVKQETDKIYMFRCGVNSIQNLELNGKELKTPDEFLNTKGLTKLFEEVINEIIINTWRPDIKNC